jgi:hypothetical protein
VLERASRDRPAAEPAAITGSMRLPPRASSLLVLSQLVEGGGDIVGMVVSTAGVGVTAPSVQMGIAVYGTFRNPPDTGNVIGCQTGHHDFTIQALSPRLRIWRASLVHQVTGHEWPAEVVQMISEGSRSPGGRM